MDMFDDAEIWRGISDHSGKGIAINFPGGNRNIVGNDCFCADSVKCDSAGYAGV